MFNLQQLQAFHNDPAIKEKYLDRVRAHYEADEIIQGVYWQNGKGCAVGCTVEQNDDPHKAMERELGIPQWLAYLEDGIFEGLSNGEAKEFPLRFLDAITPGVDLSKVRHQFLLWLLIDKHNGVIQWANDQTKAIIGDIATLQRRAIRGTTPTDAEWSAAESAAWSAAESAAWSAARSAARSAAWSAAWSAAESAARSAAWSAAESAAWSAAWSAAESAARSAARSAQYKAMADKLIRLLRQAK